MNFIKIEDFRKIEFYKKNTENILAMSKRPRKKIYKCPKCSYQTSRKYTFDRHKSVHSDTKAYWCPDCDFETTRSYRLKKHLKKHGSSIPPLPKKCIKQPKSIPPLPPLPPLPPIYLWGQLQAVLEMVPEECEGDCRVCLEILV